LQNKVVFFRRYVIVVEEKGDLDMEISELENYLYKELKNLEKKKDKGENENSGLCQSFD